MCQCVCVPQKALELGYLRLLYTYKFALKKFATILKIKPFFAPDFVLALMVSERVLERQFQGLFESGPKNWTYNLKIRANYAQMYLKIHTFHL